MSNPTAYEIASEIDHEAIVEIKTRPIYQDIIIYFVDDTSMSASEHLKSDVPEFYPNLDEDAEEWGEVAGYNWMFKEPEDEPGTLHDSDDPEDLRHAIIAAADEALENRPWPHTQIHTAQIEDGDGKEHTVMWMPEEVTGYDLGRENVGMREWAWETEEDVPISWVYNPATNQAELQEHIVQYTGSIQLTVSATRVYSEEELRPGTYYLVPPKTSSLSELAVVLHHKLDMNTDAAEEILEHYIQQMEEIDGESISRDEISEDNADFLINNVVSAQRAGDLGERELAELEEHTQLMKGLTDRRNALIMKARRAGARIGDVAAAADLSRQHIRRIEQSS